MIVLVVIMIFSLFVLLSKISINGLWTTSWIGFVLLVVIYAEIMFLRDIKWMYIDTDAKIIKYYYLFAPFGKRIFLCDYIGLLTVSEYTSHGEISIVYFVDRERTTRFRINGAFYTTQEKY